MIHKMHMAVFRLVNSTWQANIYLEGGDKLKNQDVPVVVKQALEKMLETVAPQDGTKMQVIIIREPERKIEND